MIFLTEPKKFLIFMESKYYKYSKEFWAKRTKPEA
jgi:hypothetical protein